MMLDVLHVIPQHLSYRSDMEQQQVKEMEHKDDVKKAAEKPDGKKEGDGAGVHKESKECDERRSDGADQSRTRETAGLRGYVACAYVLGGAAQAS